MPRPESPEGPWVTIPVRVRASLLAEIDAARGEMNRSEYAREALQSLVRSGEAVVPDPVEEHGFGRNAVPEGVPPVVLQPPEPERVPAPRQKAACKHPGVGRKQRCHQCGQFNV